MLLTEQIVIVCTTSHQKLQLQVKSLEACLADKAERSDMLTAVSTLQSTVGQKMDRAEADAALARKLDVRTFLASQSTVPVLDSLTLGSNPGVTGAQSGAQNAPPPPLLTYTNTAIAADASAAGTVGQNIPGVNNDTSALFTPGSARSGGRAASPHHPGPSEADIATYSALRGTTTGVDTPTLGGNHQHQHSPQTHDNTIGSGALNSTNNTSYASLLNTQQHAMSAAHASASRQNITPAVGLNRPTLKSGDMGGSSYTSAGGFNFADCVGVDRPPEVSSGALQPSLRRPPSGLGANLYSTVSATGALLGPGGQQGGALGGSGTGGLSGNNTGGMSGTLQHMHASDAWRERPGTPSSATYAHSASGKLGFSSTPMDSHSQVRFTYCQLTEHV